MDDNKSSSQFPLSGIALVMLALGVFVFAENPFYPTRPEPSTNLTSTAEDVRARLWQDPFDAVESHRKKKHPKALKPPKELKKQNQVVSDLFSNSKYQDQQHRVCSFMAEPKTNIVQSDVKDNEAHSIEELRCQIQRDFKYIEKNHSDVHILAVMVTGGAYAEDNETRIRSRYAVISGLSSVGYIPKDPEHIGYIDFSDRCDKAFRGDVSMARFCDWPASIPYEWFMPKENNKQEGGQPTNSVLVLWLNDQKISQGNSLLMLERLKFGLTPGSHEKILKNTKDVRIKFDVLGPASSTTLVKMFGQADHLCRKNIVECVSDNQGKNNNDVIRIFSSRATIDNNAINEILNKPRNEALVHGLKVELPKHHDSKVVSWFNLIRVIPSDKVLVKNILCELLRRGVNPYLYPGKEFDNEQYLPVQVVEGCSDFLVKSLNKNKRQDHIVLIGEWDTVYSRNFNKLFRGYIGGQWEINKPEWLHSYNYFRGIDGSHDKKLWKVEVNQKNDGKQEKKASFRRSVGANQFDYLRRLGDELTELSESIKKNGTIRAIGIVGSDTYDKLLVLQALRSRFPDVVFFTTDLDARMLHKDENLWARNLVVASGFGLKPEDYSFEGMPFRDSYQTALYRATVMAARNSVKVSDVVQNAKIFEIGNRVAVDYTRQPECEKSCAEKRGLDISENNQNKFLFYLCLSPLLLALLLYQTSNHTRIYILVSALVVYSVIGWVHLYDYKHSIEFNFMFSGTSIWPALIIRMVAATLSLLFIFFTLASLKRNTEYIKKKYELTFDKGTPVENLYRKNDSLDKVTLFGINITLMLQKIYLSFKYPEPGMFARIFISAWGCHYLGTRNQRNRRPNINNLITQFLVLGSTTWWFSRVMILFIMYAVLTFLFLTSFANTPYAPFGDREGALAHFHVLLVGVPLYIFLIFLVVDVTRLNARLFGLLSKCKITWPRKLIHRFRIDYGISEEVAAEKLKVNLIVDRSKAVDNLIYLPFIVLTLMILSRSSYFDRWHMPIQLAVVILLGAGIALGSAIRLRRTAKNVRHVALDNLDRLHKMQLYRESINEAPGREGSGAYNVTGEELCEFKMSERIQGIVADVKNVNTGPFAPITQHPIVKAIAMPFGGVGGLYLIDYFTNLGI